MEDETLVILAGAVVIFLIWRCVCAVRDSWFSNGGQYRKIYPNLNNLKAHNILLKNESGGGEDMLSIVDRFKSLDQVQQALRRAGLESCNLIFGIDYTQSNRWQGAISYYGLSLHDLSGRTPNPYKQVIQTLGETLSAFDDDGIIPAFGFGDITTKDQSVFPFKASGYCEGFSDVLRCYEQITPNIVMSGPTSFAPLIYRAVDIVKLTKSYHILVIVADGQVTSETSTVNAIVYASNYPLSIIMVGIGDGPWDQMHEFDDKLPARRFDNFQFVDYHKVSQPDRRGTDPDASFALHALMEIPDQYQLIRTLKLLDFT